MSIKRAIVSYDKLSDELKERLELAFPDGFGPGMTQIKTPTGQTLEALLWETDEVVYLIKLNKKPVKPVIIPDEDEFDEIPDDVKDDAEEEESDEDDYDKPEEESEESDD
jgi:hypothetical protein